jgi:hypothetical protein
MEGGQPRCQLRMVVGRGKHVVHDGDRDDADRDRGAARHAALEDMLGRVKLLDGDQCHRIAGQHRGVGSGTVHEARGVDAQSGPSRERGEEEISGLGEDAGDRERCRHADQRGNRPVDGLVQRLSACRHR